MTILSRTHTNSLRKLIASLSIATVMICVPTIASAIATLRPDIKVQNNIVTIGDMFDNAGSLANRALFRAPNVGTTGQVSVDSISSALVKYGLSNFDFDGILSVSVERPGRLFKIDELRVAIESHVRERGFIDGETKIELQFSDNMPTLFYELMEQSSPRIVDFRMSQSGRFNAIFSLPGQQNSYRTSGFLTEMMQVPMLNKNLQRGAVVQPSDVDYEFIAKQRTSGLDIALIEDIVGQALKNSKRAGTLITTRELEPPMLVQRNQMVSLILRTGSLTLTVRAQALTNGGEGDRVQVLNLSSKKIISGIATADGTVLVGDPHDDNGKRVASLKSATAIQ